MERNINPADAYADCQHVVGGWWGNHLRFVDSLPELNPNPSTMTGYRIWGHQPAKTRIEEGDLITQEYGKTWVTFKAKNIEYKTNPSDMFFGECDVVRVCEKQTGECLYYREEIELSIIAKFASQIPFVKNLL